MFSFKISPMNPNKNGVYYDMPSYWTALNKATEKILWVYDGYPPGEERTATLTPEPSSAIGTICTWPENGDEPICVVIRRNASDQLECWNTPDEYYVGLMYLGEGDGTKEKPFVIRDILYAALCKDLKFSERSDI